MFDIFIRKIKHWLGLEFPLGWVEDEPDPNDYTIHQLLDKTSIVTVKDSCSIGNPKLVVKDQGQTGSCSGNGFAQGIRAAYLLKGQDVPDLSALFAYYNSRREEGWYISDSGAQSRFTMKGIQKFGICPEENWSMNEWKINTMPKWDAYRSAAKLRGLKGYYAIKNGDVASVKAAMSSGYPVVGGWQVTQSFMEYKGGLYGNFSGKIVGGHCMLIESYDPNQFTLMNSWGCYDDQTEVLTDNGWKLFKDTNDNDTFATLNKDAGRLEYQKATAFHEYEYSGDLISFNGAAIDLLVTPNHNILYTIASDRQKNNWLITSAEKINNTRIVLKKDANYVGDDINNILVGNTSVDADTFIEFMGYFISEGCSQTSKVRRNRTKNEKYKLKNGSEKISIYKSCYDEIYRRTMIFQNNNAKGDKIWKCLQKLPFKFSKNTSGIKITFYNTCKDLFNYVSFLGKSYDKYIPDELLKLSRRQSQILLDALMLGDGTYSCGKMTYYTSSKKLADDVQHLCLRCGYASDISQVNRIGKINKNGGGYSHIEYHVKIKRHSKTPIINNKKNKIAYCGKVFCVTVPNHIIYVRRNGKAVWCGNSDWAENGRIKVTNDFIAQSTSLWALELE